MKTNEPKLPEGAEAITLGAGCFWCTEAVFQQIPGVLSVTSGYMGGETKNPSYEQICTGATGHAEVARIVFDPKKTTLAKILEVFWKAHDPTTLNQQGADEGTQYRSAIFYNSDEQRQVAENPARRRLRGFPRPSSRKSPRPANFTPRRIITRTTIA